MRATVARAGAGALELVGFMQTLKRPEQFVRVFHVKANTVVTHMIDLLAVLFRQTEFYVCMSPWRATTYHLSACPCVVHCCGPCAGNFSDIVQLYSVIFQERMAETID